MSESQSRLRDTLDRLDLSEKEIDTYLASIQLGSASVSEVAEQADISRRYVYNLVEELEAKGFLRVHDYTEPRVVENRQPSEAIDEIIDDLESAEEILVDQYDERKEEMITFDVVKSRQTALKRLRNMIDAADEELFLVLPVETIKQIRDALEDAFDRNVAIYLLETNGSGHDGNESRSDRYEGMATLVCRWEQPTPFVLARDNRGGIVGDHDLIVGSRPEADSVVIQERRLTTALFGSYVSSFWQMGEERYVAPPRELPLTYRQMRPAAMEAMLHYARDQSIYATVTVAATGETRERELTGEIVDVTQGLLSPTTNSFPLEYGLTLDTGEEQIRVGGEGAFIEPYRAFEITLHGER